jgi:hypothetical protein
MAIQRFGGHTEWESTELITQKSSRDNLHVQSLDPSRWYTQLHFVLSLVFSLNPVNSLAQSSVEKKEISCQKHFRSLTVLIQ